MNRTSTLWLLAAAVMASGAARSQDVDSKYKPSEAGKATATRDINRSAGGSRATDTPANPDGPASQDVGDERGRNARMLIQTLAEEKTEVANLAAQQAAMRKAGGEENQRIARLWGRWIREHKAAAPTLERLIRANGGDPSQAQVLKKPTLGERKAMLDATHRDHQAAVMTSQMRFGATDSGAIRRAMSKRARLARKHIRQMAPFHSGRGMTSSEKEMQRDETIAVQG